MKAMGVYDFGGPEAPKVLDLPEPQAGPGEVRIFNPGSGISTGGASRLVPLPSSGSDPSEAECVGQIQANGTYNLGLTRGARFCAVSRDGRTAYLRAVAAPAEGTLRLEVTVWELPS